MNETLKVIKSTVEASDFHYWLMEHPEVKNVQGYDTIGGLPKDCTGHLMNAYDMYQERHIFNIRAVHHLYYRTKIKNFIEPVP